MERRLGRGLGSLLGQTGDAIASREPVVGSGETKASAGSESDGVDADAGKTASTRRADSNPRSESGQKGGSGQKAAPSPEVGPATHTDGGRVVARMVDVAAIRRNADQPRKVFDSESLDELRSSIEQHGVLQPIQVRRVGSSYEIISGERRWRAARSARLSEIPAVVREDVNDAFSLELAIVENVQRRDLDPLEKARGYRALMDRVGLTQDQVAKKIGVSRSAVANHLRLLELPDDALEALAQGLITMGHAKALLGGKDKKAILAALGSVVRKDLSVRETESLMKRPSASTAGSGSANGSASDGAPSKAELKPAAPWVGELEGRIREALGAKITLRNGAKYRGSITIEYSGREELERICDSIAPKETL